MRVSLQEVKGPRHKPPLLFSTIMGNWLLGKNALNKIGKFKMTHRNLKRWIFLVKMHVTYTYLKIEQMFISLKKWATLQAPSNSGSPYVSVINKDEVAWWICSKLGRCDSQKAFAVRILSLWVQFWEPWTSTSVFRLVPPWKFAWLAYVTCTITRDCGMLLAAMRRRDGSLCP